MKKLLVILPFFLLLFACNNYRASRGPADWIYVSTTGNDVTGDGTSGNPYLTIATGISHASAGDTVFIVAGTYNVSTQIVHPVGISLLGEGDASHIITTYTNASATQAAIQCASTVGTTTNDGGSISNLKISGSNLTSTRAIYVGYRNNVTIENVTIEDFNHGGIWLHISGSYPTLYASGNTIQNCTINNSSSRDGDYFPAAIRLSGQTECDILNNVIDMTSRDAGDNGNSIEFQRCKKTRIDGNTHYRLDHELANWNFFFEGWDYAGDFDYTNNTHYGLGKVSFGGEYNKRDVDCSYGFKAIGNKFYNDDVGYRTVSGENATLYAINMEGDGHVDGTISKKYIQNYGVGIELSTPESGVGYWHHYWDWTNIEVSYNFIDGVGYQDHAYAYGIFWINETNLYPYYGVFNNIGLVNNTIIAHDGATYDGYQGIGIFANDTVNDLRVSNNIAYDFSNYGISVTEHGTDTLVLTGLDVTYNNMYSNGTNTVNLESAAGRITVTDSDITTGNITTDPLFMPAGNFRLQSTSPAINAGISVGLTTDYFGHRVPQNDTVDIGAHEYGNYLVRLPSGNFLRTANGKLLITH